MSDVSTSPPATRRARRTMRTWNRRVHTYAGLYFLGFIWLFALSGLLLNHSDWAIATFWPDREERSRVVTVESPAATRDVPQAMELMRQLHLVGELNQTGRDPETGRLEFQVARPGASFAVEVDLESRRATITETRVNGSGVLQTLHSFSGVKIDEPARRRDWLLTKVWSFAMDALAVGLIVMVGTGVFLWLLTGRNRLTGAISLAAGLASCLFFAFALTLLFGA